MKHQNQFTLHAKNGMHGLEIYLIAFGREYYITTHRSNGLLWQKLKGGVALGALRRVKPWYTHTGQKYYHYSRYLLKIVDEYIRQELTV